MQSMQKITGRNISYIVDEKNRVVVARLEPNFNASAFINNLNMETTTRVYVADKYDVNCFGCFDSDVSVESFRGVAHCSPDDEFDPEIGKKIARKRLEKAFWKSYIKREKILADRLKDVSVKFLREVKEHERYLASIDPLETLNYK